MCYNYLFMYVFGVVQFRSKASMLYTCLNHCVLDNVFSVFFFHLKGKLMVAGQKEKGKLCCRGKNRGKLSN
jgi:hypothetical protein